MEGVLNLFSHLDLKDKEEEATIYGAIFAICRASLTDPTLFGILVSSKDKDKLKALGHALDGELKNVFDLFCEAIEENSMEKLKNVYHLVQKCLNK